LSGDIGFAVFDKFRDAYPERFMNFGIAEANMMGASAGLALSGMRPFTYTIIPFLTMRAFEQIRVDVCLQNQPVKIIGVGGGLAYGNLGPTHHSIEDVAILRALPNMTVITPSDPGEAKRATVAAHQHDGPVYIRLGKNGEPKLYEAQDFVIGRALTLRDGRDATIVSAGPILQVALAAADLLGKRGLACRVINMPTIKPLDAEAIEAAAEETDAILVLEEHSIIGGLGSAVAEVVAEQGTGVKFRRVGVRDQFCHAIGSQAFHWADQGWTPEGIAGQLTDLLGFSERSLRLRTNG
jgi:transketolase